MQFTRKCELTEPIGDFGRRSYLARCQNLMARGRAGDQDHSDTSRASLVATWCRSRIARTRDTVRCAVHDPATPARYGSDSLRPRIASTMRPFAPAAYAAAAEQHCPLAVTALDAVRLPMAALGAHVGAELQRAIVCVRHMPDYHRP